MSKLVLASNPNMAEALIKKVPEFSDAEVVSFGAGVREKIKGQTVLTSSIPDNMVHLPETVVLCTTRIRPASQEALDSDELAWNLSPFVAFKANALDAEEAKANW